MFQLTCNTKGVLFYLTVTQSELDSVKSAIAQAIFLKFTPILTGRLISQFSEVFFKL